MCVCVCVCNISPQNTANMQITVVADKQGWKHLGPRLWSFDAFLYYSWGPKPVWTLVWLCHCQHCSSALNHITDLCLVCLLLFRLLLFRLLQFCLLSFRLLNVFTSICSSKSYPTQIYVQFNVLWNIPCPIRKCFHEKQKLWFLVFVHHMMSVDVLWRNTPKTSTKACTTLVNPNLITMLQIEANRSKNVE